MSFLVGFLLEALIGMIAFWFLEVSSLLFIYMMINYFLSGHMLPLDLLPASLDGGDRLAAVQVPGVRARRDLPGPVLRERTDPRAAARGGVDRRTVRREPRGLPARRTAVFGIRRLEPAATRGRRGSRRLEWSLVRGRWQRPPR